MIFELYCGPSCGDCFSEARPLYSVLLRIVFVVTNNIYCIPSYVMWMVMLMPLRRLFPELYWRIEGLLFHWLLAMVSMWSDTAGYRIVEVGDEIGECVGERTLVLANHQSTGDVPVLMSTLNARRGVLPKLMWIMDRLFKYTNFGIVSVLHGDFFIASGRDKRDASAKELRGHLKDFYVLLERNWIVLFPEGGFLRKRRETSQKYAIKNNLPLLKNVSLPRVGALKIIVDEVGPNVPTNSMVDDDYIEKTQINNVSTSNTKNILNNVPLNKNKLSWVLDITIGYENGIPIDLTNIVTGKRPPCTTHLHYRLYPSTKVPKDHDSMTEWLYDRFVEKEKLLEYFYENGHFPALCPDGITRNNKPILVVQNYIRFLLIHLFFIMSFILHVYLIYNVYQFLVIIK